MSHSLNTTILVILIIALIVYTIVIFWAYTEGKWIFSPYVQPPLPGGFQPAGKVVSLSALQQKCRKEVLLSPTGPSAECRNLGN